MVSWTQNSLLYFSRTMTTHPYYFLIIIIFIVPVWVNWRVRSELGRNYKRCIAKINKTIINALNDPRLKKVTHHPSAHTRTTPAAFSVPSRKFLFMLLQTIQQIKDTLEKQKQTRRSYKIFRVPYKICDHLSTRNNLFDHVMNCLLWCNW